MQNDEQAIRELIKAWLSASKAGDTDAVLKLMADDVVFLIAGHSPMRGRSEFAASQAAMKDIDLEATSEVQEIKVFGDWAYVWTNLAITVTPRNGGAAVKRAGNTLSILQKRDGKWVIFRDANMLTTVA
jgi:uncharacterized protein (TIGR02246 family)